MLYTLIMKVGQQTLQKRDYPAALARFARAAYIANQNSDKASALEMQGITLHRQGKLDEAVRTLKPALRLAKGDPTLIAHINRDLAMVLVDQAQFDEADRLLSASYLSLVESNRPIEAATTLGYQARVDLLRGDRSEAIGLLRQADSTLLESDNHSSELDNLIWLMRASRYDRFRMLPRALQLIRETQQARMLEVAVVVIGGDYLSKRLRGKLGK